MAKLPQQTDARETDATANGPLRIEIGRCWLAADRADRLRGGDVVVLDEAVEDDVCVYRGRVPIARGQLVTVNGKLGVRVREVLVALALLVAAMAWGPTQGLVADELTTRAVPASGPAGDGSGSIEDGALGGGRGSDLGDWWQTAAALAIVVGLIFLVRYVLRRLGGLAKPGRKSTAMEVLARQSLSGRHQLYLVRVGRRVLLIGAGTEGLSTLAEVRDDAEARQLLRQLAGGDSDDAKDGGGQ